MNIRVPGCLALALLASCRSGSNLRPGEPERAEYLVEQSLPVGGTTRWFLSYRPESIEGSAPLVIVLHGGTRSMSELAKQFNGLDWLELADRQGFLLLIPNGIDAKSGSGRGTDQHWNDHRRPAGEDPERADDVAFLDELVDWAAATHGVDRSACFLTGASNGGMMTYRALLESPGTFAAGAAFVANLPAKTPPELQAGPPVPILIVNGTEDPLMTWEGGMTGKRGQRDTVLSAQDTVNWWCNRNRTGGATITQLPNLDRDDDCRLEQYDFPGGSAGADVRFVTMHGGGHVVPTRRVLKRRRWIVRRIIGPECRDANGAELAWDFFRAQIRER